MTIKKFSSLEEASDHISIEGTPAVFKNSSIFVNLESNDNRIKFFPGSKVDGCTIKFHSHGSLLVVGEASKITGNVFLGLNSNVLIGGGLTITAAAKISCSESTTIKIGDDCMFGVGVEIASHDFHPIFKSDGDRLNVSKDVVIGDHVWLGNQALILKGSSIKNGVVVGARAVFSGDSLENSVYAGNPAKLLKSDIFWDRSSLNTTPPYKFNSIKDLPNVK